METLRIYCDGGARGNPGPAAGAFVVVDSRGKIIFKKGKYLGTTTNNVAEYFGVLLGLEWVAKKNITIPTTFFLDSLLIVNQLNSVYKIRDKKLIRLVQRVKEKERGLPVKIFYRAVVRRQNKAADFLVNKVLDAETPPKNIA